MPNERNSHGPPQSCGQLARHLDLLARVCPQNPQIPQLICTILGLNRSCRILVNRRRRNPLDRACVHQLARNIPTPSRASFYRMDPFESHQIRRIWSIRREIMYYVPDVNCQKNLLLPPGPAQHLSSTQHQLESHEFEFEFLFLE